MTSFLSGRMAEFCIQVGLPVGAIVTALTRTPEGRSVTALAEAGMVPQRDFETMLAPQLGLPADGLIALDGVGVPPRAETADLAQRARASGNPVGLLSNSWGGGGHDVYTGYDLAALFDVVVISHVVGLRKPEPPIFERAAAKVGVAPRDCVFVDDTLANVATGRELGMAAVHFTGQPGQVAEVEQLIGLRESGARVADAGVTDAGQ